jgi:mannose-6-phosphate isomerase-like protein (cupin superfamily)
MALREHELEDELRKEGFKHTYVWQDGADTWYPDHVHAKGTAHMIVEGEMLVTINGKSRTYVVGERCDVPGGMAHSAKMGPKGCRYVVGEM